MRIRNHSRVLLAAGALTALFASTAFTADNTFAADSTVPITGYASTVVSGGTINQLTYNLNAAGDNVDTVTLVLNGDTTTSAVSIGFNGGATTSCGVGVYDGSAETTYTCDSDGAGGPFTQATADLDSTAVVIN